jgi:hypothetical protein
MKNTCTQNFKMIMLSAILLMAAGLQSVQAQTVIWSDNFDAPTGGANNNNGGVGWTGAQNTPGGGPNTDFFGFLNTWAIGANATCSSGNKLYVRSTLQNTNSFVSDVYTDKYNATPNISTVGFTGLTLQFTWRCIGTTGLDYGQVGFSGDGGTTWNWSSTLYQDQPSCTQSTVAVPTQFENIANFKIAYRFVSNATSCSACDPPFNIDDIVLSGSGGSTCTPPTVSAGSAVSICAGESLTIGGSPTATGGSPSNYVYTWTPSSGLSSTSAANPVATPSQTTTYTVSVNGGDAACTATASITVTVNPAQTIAITPAGNQTICAGQSVGLSAAAGFSNYVWSTPSGNVLGQTVTASETGSYSVSADGSGGCGATSTPVVITVDAPFNVSVTPAGPITLCEGETVTLVAQNGFSNYQWSNNTPGQQLVVSSSGGYSVSANNGNGCSGASQVVNVTISPAPVAGFTYEQINDDYEVEFTNTSQNSVSYLWDFGAGNTSTLENPTFAFDFDNTWPVTLTVTSPCGTDTFTTGVITIKTSIPEIDGLQLSMLPNPGKDQFVLKGSADIANNFTLRVMNVQGQVLFQQQQKIAGTFLIPVDMSEFASGIYFVVLETSDGRNTLRWIKE